MISVITINLNNFKGLLSTIKSFKSQQNIQSQLVVIDGLSSDGSREYLFSDSNLMDVCISEIDKGIYNAMNKGIRNSSNDYVLFLNSGDTFHDSESLNSLFENITGFDIVYGNIIDLGNNKTNVVTYPEYLFFEYMLCSGLPHQATLIKKTLFSKVGFYKENYKIISDWVFFMEALFIHNVSYKHIPIVISNFEGGGLSSISKNTALILFEQLDYISQRFPNSLLYYYNNSPYVKKYLRQKPRALRWFFKYMLVTYNKVFQ